MTKLTDKQKTKTTKKKQLRQNICVLSIFITITVCISIFVFKENNIILNQEVIIIPKTDFFQNILKKDDSQAISSTLKNNKKQKVKTFDFSNWNKNTENIDLMILNKNNGIPENYPVNIENKQGFIFNNTGIDMFINLINDGRSQGIDLIINSSYRSVENQKIIFDNDVNKYINQGFSEDIASQKASVFIQKPGYSEHNFGICADIVSQEYPYVEQDFEKTKAFKWLDENAHKYGFILRYPKDKEDITLIGYEPWHYRYVGVEHATKIKQNGVCLEEYVYDLINLGNNTEIKNQAIK